MDLNAADVEDVGRSHVFDHVVRSQGFKLLLRVDLIGQTLGVDLQVLLHRIGQAHLH